MKSSLLSRIVLLLCALAASATRADQLLVIQGAPGESDYAQRFEKAADQWLSLAEEASIPATRIAGSDGEFSTKVRIQNWITKVASRQQETLWIVYLGHGTFSASGAKLNIAGPDISAEELRTWLEPIKSQLVFVHGGSASAPFLSSLSAPNRVIITATRSGTEQNYARFGELFVHSLRSQRSDIDLDGRVSLLEAFVSASSAVETFYIEAGRLTSEHALLDDNGDARGTPANRFQGLRPVSSSGSNETVDGRLARRLSLLPASGERLLTPDQIEERDALEAQLEILHTRKANLAETEYYSNLEEILTELSKLYLDPETDS
ncbi:hypothetical protein VDG1235_3816 [Verrucomicrobiia bacterium DG1235]|nr:hypothetical protein VDG1235_3816 [Verrucomicrobiae bacterium DG1235]